MKKLLFVMIAMLCIITGCQKQEGTIKKEYINVAQIKEKISNKETFVFSISRVDCPHCQNQHKMLDAYHANGVFYIFEVSKASEAEIAELLKLYPTVNSTPTTFYYEKGELKETLVGFNKEKLKTLLEKVFKK